MALFERDGVQDPVQDRCENSPVTGNLLFMLANIPLELREGREACLVQRLKLFVRGCRQKGQGRVLQPQEEDQGQITNSDPFQSESISEVGASANCPA